MITSRFFVLMMCIGLGKCADQPIKMELEHVVTKARDLGDADVVGYEVIFDLHISNLGNHEVIFGSAPLFVSVVQARQSDGQWKTVSNSSFYDTGNIHYSSCSQLAPGKSVTIQDAKSHLMLLKTQLKELGIDPVLRFLLQAFCQQPDGTKAGTPVVATEPFTIHLQRPSA